MENENKAIDNKKLLEGKMNFEIELIENDIGIRLEDSNENRLASAHLISLMYDELWNRQMAAGKPEHKLSKTETKELQIARKFLGKHISMLGRHIHDKYKDSIFTKDKPKIDIITQADILNNPNLKIKK